MASVKVTGEFLDHPVEATWTDGKVEADPLLMGIIHGLVTMKTRVGLTPVGPFYAAGTEDGWQFAATAAHMLADPQIADSGLPELPASPPNAQA